MASEHKLFGRYHELVLLVLGFCLTGVLGTIVAQNVQDRSWRFQRDAEHRDREVDAATKVFDDVSRLMDRRLYRTRQVLWALQGNIPEADTTARWADYRAVLYEWNDALNRNLALVERYFGVDMRNELEGHIHNGLRTIGEQLEDYRKAKSKDPTALKTAADLADRVNFAIYGLNLAMLKQIQGGDVGAFRSSGEK
jgi:hypothetical protein